jgi:hypothetical protein
MDPHQHLLCFLRKRAKFLQHFFSSAEEAIKGFTEGCRSSIRREKIVVVIQEEHVVHCCPQRYRATGLRCCGLYLPVFWRLTLKYFNYSQGGFDDHFRFATKWRHSPCFVRSDDARDKNSSCALKEQRVGLTSA